MRYAVAMIVGLTLAGPVCAGQKDFDRALAGKVAGVPRRCISPDLSVQPIILDGKAILYFRGRQVYVNRFGHGGCSQAREGRILVTTGEGSQLCRNDPVSVREPAGAPTDGFCTLGDFTPYTKAK